MTARQSAKASVTINPPDGDVIEGTTVPKIPVLRSVPDAKQTRVEAFEIDGKVYSIAAKPKVNTALRYLHISRVQGTEAGIDYMLGILLGAEAYEALMAFDDLTEEQLTEVITMASKIMAGAVEAPKGKRKTG